MLILHVPEFIPLVLKGIESDPHCWGIVTAYLELRDAKQDRPNASERAQRQTELINLQNYRAHHFACYLFVPLLVWAADASPQILPDSYRNQAFDLLVEITSALPIVLLFGYSPFLILSESNMVDIQCERWVKQGGFPALLMATVYFQNSLLSVALLFLTLIILQLNKPGPTSFSDLIMDIAREEDGGILHWLRNKEDAKNIMQILLVHFDLFDSAIEVSTPV
jgi:hypothetical protein